MATVNGEQIDLMPTDGMKEEAQRYRGWKADGNAGGTEVAATRAGQILSGDELSPKTVITMAAWFARHEVDKQGEGFNPGEDGYPSPGRVAWAAWGGDAGQSWSTAKADRIKALQENRAMESGRPYPNEHAARLTDPGQYDSLRRENDAGGPGIDFIYGIKAGKSEIQAIRFRSSRFTAAEAKKWLADHGFDPIQFEEATGDGGARDITPDMSPRQVLMYESLEDIVETVGQFQQDIGANGAHYVDGSGNPFAAEGMVCANCAFYQGPKACELVTGEIDPAGICKLWVIPERLLTMDQPEAPIPAVGSEQRDMAEQGLRRFHSVAFNRAAEDGDGRTFEFPFSSEYPVARYFGNEILNHDPQSADLSRLNDSAPLLFNHNPDKVIGVVERAYIDGSSRRGYARVRFSRNAFAQEVLSDVKDGVLRNVSFGYSIDKMEERGGGDFVATAWSPYEISVVSIPADKTVGIGRSLMPNEPAASAAPTPDPVPQMDNTTPDLAVVRAEAAEAERSRIAGISALCDKHGMGDLGRQLVESGRSIDEARAIVLDKLGAKPIETVAPIDMPLDERADYSITAGIRAMLTGDWSSREAGLVREVSKQVEKSGLVKTTERSFFVPFGALAQRATYVTSGATTGGNLVATDLLADQFIEFLRNQAVMLNLGVRTLPGLVGNVAIPRRSAVASTYYLSTQTTAITQSESTFDQVTMTPKNLAALSKYSRQTLLQGTPGIEELVRRDLTDGITLAIDLGILNGSGSSGQPTGIMQTSGIGSVAMGTNGGAITLEKVVDLEAAVMNVNGAVNPDNVAYVTNYKVLAALKKLRAGGSTTGDGPFLFNVDGAALGRYQTPAALNGYPLAATNQVPSNLTKGTSSGVCSALVMGDFSQAMVGFWGNGLEITVGEDSDDFSKALTSVRGIVSYDVAVRDPKSFAAILDITT